MTGTSGLSATAKESAGPVLVSKSASSFLEMQHDRGRGPTGSLELR